MAARELDVAVIGGGVVGCAVAWALARRGVRVELIEALPQLALGASGANSGILHTGFDSPPGELETRLILRSAELRDKLVPELEIDVWRCGARMRGERRRARGARTARGQRAHERRRGAAALAHICERERRALKV